VAAFEVRLNREPYAVADRLWVKDTLDPDKEKLRFSNSTRFSMERARGTKTDLTSTPTPQPTMPVPFAAG